MKNLFKSQEIMILQLETLYNICITKIIIKSLALISQDKQIQAFLNKLISQENY